MEKQLETPAFLDSDCTSVDLGCNKCTQDCSLRSEIHTRIDTLTNPSAPEFNKSNLVGKNYAGFFGSEQVLRSGHNNAGFVLDDETPYLEVFRVISEEKITDTMELIYVIDCQKRFYFLPDNWMDFKSLKELNKAVSNNRVWRDKVFYDPENAGVYSISDIKGGAACTEKTAVVHNMLKICGVESLYCVDGFTRGGEGIDSKSPDHTSLKHSFIVVKNPEDNALYIYDPTEYYEVEHQGEMMPMPMLVPINKETAVMEGPRLTLSENITSPNGKTRHLEYTISNFPNCLIKMNAFGLCGDLSGGTPTDGVLNIFHN